MDLNKITLIGNMVREPESGTTTEGQHVTRFSLATNYAWQDARTKAKKETVDFHDIIAWGKLGDIVKQYVRKGSKIYVEGRLRRRMYTTKDSERRVITEIVADNMIMLGHRTTPDQAAQGVSRGLIKDDVDVAEMEN